LVNRQDEGARRRVHQIVCVLDALGNAFARQKAAKTVTGDEACKLLVADVCVNRHAALTSPITSELLGRRARHPYLTGHVEDEANWSSSAPQRQSARRSLPRSPSPHSGGSSLRNRCPL